ncbi:hypothetical protein BC828DRAFT_440205 [Blastocladiella britannica]|nr:hypothetical protein BC828DRAFT_440205 [Blastocladiella britannica]
MNNSGPTLSLDAFQSSQAPFDPFDIDDIGVAYRQDIFLLIQELVYLPCNLFVLWLVFKNHKLANNPPNILYISVIFHNTLFLLQCIVIRIAVLAAGGAWSHAWCIFYSMSTCYFYSIGTGQVLNLALERFTTVILEQKFTIKMGFLSILNAHILAMIFTYLHSLYDAKYVLSLSGEFCYPTTLGLTWIGPFALIIMVLSLLSTLGYLFKGVYGLIVLHIRRSLDKVANASHSSPPKSMEVSGEASSSSQRGQKSGGSPNETAHQPRLKSRRAAMERRILLRGIAAAFGLCFTVVPHAYMVWYMQAYRSRSPASTDRLYTAIKMTTEAIDPLILILLDSRFSGDAKAVLVRWFPTLSRWFKISASTLPEKSTEVPHRVSTAKSECKP